MKLGIGVFLVALVTTVLFVPERWERLGEFAAPFNPRNPAAFHELESFENYQGEALLEKVKSHMAKLTKLDRTGDYLDVRLPHFRVRNPTGGPSISACDLYERVNLEFEAEGVFVFGHGDDHRGPSAHGDHEHQGHSHNSGPEKPSMTVEAECFEDLNDGKHFAPIRVPLTALLSDGLPGTGIREIDFGERMSVRFNLMDDSWPSEWTLKKIQLKDRNQVVKDISVGEDTFREQLKEERFKKLSFSWKRP